MAVQETAIDLPEGFKMTELGPLPEEWRVVRLGEVMKQRKEFIFVDDNTFYKRPTIKLHGQGIVLRDVVAGANLKIKKQQVCYSTDFVVAEIDAKVGGFGVVPPSLDGAILSSHYFIFELNKELIDPAFVEHLVKTPILQRQVEARGSTNYASVRPSQVSSYLIPLPPLLEQRAIAHVLRTVQRAKEATERVIAALKELKKSLMRHLFTYGPVPIDQADRVPLKDTEIGPIPEHWQVVRLGEVVRNSFSGGTPSTKVAKYWGGDIPWITSAYLAENDVFLKGYQRTITQEGLKNSATRLAPSGSLIVGTRVGVGKAVLTTFDVAISQDLTALVLSKDVEAVFLVYLFKSGIVQAQLQERTRGTTIKGIPRKELLGALIPLPTLPEQQEIARILQTVDRRIAAEEAYARALGDLFKSLLQELMTGRRRVKVAAEEVTQSSPGGSS